MIRRWFVGFVGTMAVVGAIAATYFLIRIGLARVPFGALVDVPFSILFVILLGGCAQRLHEFLHLTEAHWAGVATGLVLAPIVLWKVL